MIIVVTKSIVPVFILEHNFETLEQLMFYVQYDIADICTCILLSAVQDRLAHPNT